MNPTWTHTRTLSAQALCLRGGVRVPVYMAMESIAFQKDFVDHDPGGSDG